MNPVRQFYVYLHCRPDGTPFYVGKGGGSRCKRSHKFKQRNHYHQNIVKKYGEENIIVLVFPMLNETSAFQCEIDLIRLFKSLGFYLANLTDGGEGASNPSPETRAKKSKSMTGHKNFNVNGHSEETKILISESSKRLWSNPKHRIYMSNKMKTRIFTEIHKQRISDAKRGVKRA